MVENKPKQEASGVVGKSASFVSGCVAGAASSVAVNTIASEKSSQEIGIAEHDLNSEGAEYAAQNINPADLPSEQDVIIATDEGIRVAQVDDTKSFAEAFSDARAQVGPGGVFEWHGKVYGTYYKAEWEQMSAAERAEWQARVDYNDVSDVHYEQQEHIPSNSHSTSSHFQQEESLVVEDSSDSGEIRILGVEEVTDGQGHNMTIAGIGNDSGDQILLIDVDQDGNFDAGWHDDNGDGLIQEHELFDASGCAATVDDLLQAEAQQNGTYYVANDGMPDYTNDADVSSFI